MSSEEEDDPPPTPCCECDCENPADQEACAESGQSSGPVRYGTGQIVHTETDLTSNAFGIRWGHTRSYANVLVGTGGNGSSLNGNRWYVRQLKELSFQFSGGSQPSRVIVADGANSSQYFVLDASGASYVNEFAGWNSLVWNAGAAEFLLTIARTGQQWIFYDHSGGVSAGLRGQLKRVVDPAGRVVSCSYDANNNLEKFEQVVGGQKSGFYYEWGSQAFGAWVISTVTLRLNDENVRRARFSYYSGSESGGNLNDLKSAVIEQFDPSTDIWKVVDQKLYRYYRPGDPGGFVSGMKLVIGAGAYENMLAAGLNPETATDAELAGFADFYYEYDAEKRVSLEKLEGGRRQYSFAYETNPDFDGAANTWLTKTVETLPDGSENRVYTNGGYNVLVKILQEAGTANQWVNYWQYNDRYRVTAHAHPSAVESVSEPGGGSSALDVVLRETAGRIDVFAYYSSTDPSTGAAAGYIFTKGVKQGSLGASEVREKLKYDTRTVGSVSIHPVKERLVYPVAGMVDSAAPKTIYSRTWYDNGGAPTFQVLELTITDPVVTAAENGSGTAGVSKQVFDRYGRVNWRMDQRGIITFTSYVQATGALLQRIEDVNTDLTPDAPSGWVASGMNLVIDFVSDDQGRITQTRAPWHEAQLREEDTAPTAIRRVEFATYNCMAREERRAIGYMTGDDPTADFAVVGAVRVTRLDGYHRVVDVIQAVRCCNCGPLTRLEALPQEKWSRWTHRIYDPWGRLFAERVYHAIPAQGEGEAGANYLETIYGYDGMGRQNRVVDPAGTIQRVVFDVRGLTISRWIGTNDTGATDTDPTGGGAAGNNMKLAAAMQYDGGAAGGDGNLTQETRPVDGTSGNDRITTYGYDYRDRRDTVTQTDGTTTWITKTAYDNLDRITGVTRYHTAVDNANRITQGRTFFDALGRVYKEETDGIDPASGNVTGTVKGEKWYDLASNVIKQYQPGSTAFNKMVFDALNRPAMVYLACRPGTAGVPAGDDNNVSTDTVIEQRETVYDPAGNVIEQRFKQRLDDATGTGQLGDVTTNPKARVSWTAIWPDAIGRVRVTADFGTNGGAPLNRPAMAPERSDTILVTTQRYKDSGEQNAIIDPMGIETRWENDKAGRRIRLEEGRLPSLPVANGLSSPASSCTPSSGPPPATPRITEFVWHSSGQLEKLILVNADTGNQVTRWLFGSTLAESAIASNSLVRAKIYPESDDRPAPASDGPDGVYARLEYSYNRQGQAISFKDADGTTHEYAYNKLGLMTEDRVPTLAVGLNGDVRRIGYGYDQRNLVSKVTSYNAASGGSVVNEAAFEYDSFQQLKEDKQSHSGAVGSGTPKVEYAYETGGAKNTIRRISTQYPTTSRILEVQYGTANAMDDHLGRVSALKVNGESANLVDYTYCGTAWQVRVGYPQPELELTYKKLTGAPTGDSGDPYSGYDRFGRSVDMPWLSTTDDSVIERSQYGFDRNSRRTWQKRPLTDTQDLHHDYDALGQVSASVRGSLNLNTTAISGIPAAAESWDYDPTGNWRGYETRGPNGGITLDQQRVHDRGNRLTQIVDNAFPTLLDRAGRMTQSAPDAGGNWSGRLEIVWDAWSRIKTVMNNGATVGTYSYDGLHRRVTRQVGGVTWHTYYSDTWRPLEERKNAESTAAISYLWGARHRDDLVRRDRAVGGTVLNETRYVLMDYFNPSAITDETGVVKERYGFSAFGVRRMLAPDFSPRSSSESAFEFGFQGQFLDTESGFYNYGYRYYSPYLGRWLCKDPLGELGGVNLYGMVDNGPVNVVDLLGLANMGFNCDDKCVDQCAGRQFANVGDRFDCEDECRDWKNDDENCPCGEDENDDDDNDDSASWCAEQFDLLNKMAEAGQILHGAERAAWESYSNAAKDKLRPTLDWAISIGGLFASSTGMYTSSGWPRKWSEAGLAASGYSALGSTLAAGDAIEKAAIARRKWLSLNAALNHLAKEYDRLADEYQDKCF